MVGRGAGGSIGKWSRFVDANDANPALVVNQRGTGLILDLRDGGVTVLSVGQDGAVILSGTGSLTVADGKLLRWGTDGDTGSSSVPATTANTAITGLLEGTPVTPLAIAADSLVIGNITNNGDILLAVSKAGTSYMAFMADASTGDTLLGVPTGQSIDFYIAGVKQVDYAAGALAFQQATTINTTVGDLALRPTGNVTVLSSKLIIRNPADTFSYTITGAALAADRILNLPLLTGTDTLASLGLAQTFTMQQTLSAVSAPALVLDRTTSTGSVLQLKYGGATQFNINVDAGNFVEMLTVAGVSFRLTTATSPAGVAGQTLTIRGAAGGSGTGSAGGPLYLTGGAAGGTDANGGRVILTTGAKAGSGLKPLVELDASGGVPTTAVLGEDFVAFKYNPAGTLVVYVVDGGVVKSLSLGTPT